MMQVLVSTDVIGFLGLPKDIEKAYGETKTILNTKGYALNLEVIGWKHSYRFFKNQASRYGFNVVGLHGKIGKLKFKYLKDRLMFNLMNGALIGSQRLLKQKINSGYILIHESEVPHIAKLLKKNNCKTLLMIENNPSRNSLKSTVAAVRNLNKTGINVGIMVDLVHTIKEVSETKDLNKMKRFRKYYLDSLLYIKESITDLKTVGFHISIGNNHDSLPKNTMERADWKILGKMIKDCGDRCRYVVLENQHNKSRFYLFNKDAGKIEKETASIVETLADDGVI
ncbi:MAG: hypothetical protein ACOX6N_03505 [Patescibacteria group bacterium]|jgi:hypothetical protein